jgi:hypothetical protein
MWCAACLIELYQAGLLEREDWYVHAENEAGHVVTIINGHALCRPHFLQRDRDRGLE